MLRVTAVAVLSLLLVVPASDAASTKTKSVRETLGEYYGRLAALDTSVCDLMTRTNREYWAMVYGTQTCEEAAAKGFADTEYGLGSPGVVAMGRRLKRASRRATVKGRGRKATATLRLCFEGSRYTYKVRLKQKASWLIGAGEDVRFEPCD